MGQDYRVLDLRHLAVGDRPGVKTAASLAAGPAVTASHAPIPAPPPDQESPKDRAWSFQPAGRAFADPDGEAATLAAILVDGDEDAASSDPSSFFTAANESPIIQLAQIYSSDFESADDARWVNYLFGDDIVDTVPRADDGTGNFALASQGPWWFDLNHAFPGAGELHLLSTLFADGSNGGIVVDDFRDVTFSFDIRADQLQMPEGAHIYLWFQALDPTLPWGVGQYVNYANISVPVDELLVDGAWVHVSITMSQIETDWVALGSNPDREGDYSISSSIVAALSGNPVNFGLIMLLGNEPSSVTASGVVRLDNVIISHGDVVRLKFAPEALIGQLQPLRLDVDISDPDTTAFQGYSISADYQGGGLAGEMLALAFPSGSDLVVVDGVLTLGGSQIGTVTGGLGGIALLIQIIAPVNAAILNDIVGALAYRNQNAEAGEVRGLLVELDDGQGGQASLAVEVIARLSLDDGSGDDHLVGTVENETLKGGLGSDRLEGAAGDDRLDGGPGIDITVGGTGDDWHFVDNGGDVVIEAIGEGALDRVFASVSYALTAGAEIEILSTSFNAGTVSIDLTGNELHNAIFGNAGANRLSGGAGNDTLAGNEGNDVLDGGLGADFTIGATGDDWHFVDDGGDVVSEAAGGGADRVFASVSYVLTAGQAVEVMSTTLHAGTAAIDLTGNALAQVIYGNAGANRLSGGGGGDALIGFEGNDEYFVVDSRDLVREFASGGTDRIFASISYVLAAGEHVETLSTDNDNGTGAINLTGNALAQLIIGNNGANQLSGGGGGDRLTGLGGNDFYFVTDVRDVVRELAAGGTDRVFASVSYALPAGAEVEMLTTSNNAGTAALNLAGNALAQGIYGNAGANQLSGGGGADSLVGFEGDDWYFIVSGQENVFESAGGGSDRIFAAADYRLRAGAEVELLTTDYHPGTAAIDLAGNEFAQAVYGNAGANILDGGAGRDVLIGNGGADIFLFSTALNTAFGTPFNTLAATANVDRIDGFAFDDRIGLDAVRFGLTPGALPAGAFALGSTATQADDRILYDQATGALLFDSDGSGAAAAQLFAYINGPFSPDASFFVVI